MGQWQKENLLFPIIYHYIKNGGKHRAINTGAKMAKGDIFFIVDSDDFLVGDAAEFVLNEYGRIADDQGIVGLSGLIFCGREGNRGRPFISGLCGCHEP